MPIRIRELIIKGTVDKKSGATKSVDVVDLINTKINDSPPRCNLDRPSFVEDCVKEVLHRLRQELDY
jgi:hypothetical protein